MKMVQSLGSPTFTSHNTVILSSWGINLYDEDCGKEEKDISYYICRLGRSGTHILTQEHWESHKPLPLEQSYVNVCGIRVWKRNAKARLNSHTGITTTFAKIQTCGWSMGHDMSANWLLWIGGKRLRSRQCKLSQRDVNADHYRKQRSYTIAPDGSLMTWLVRTIATLNWYQMHGMIG